MKAILLGISLLFITLIFSQSDVKIKLADNSIENIRKYPKILNLLVNKDSSSYYILKTNSNRKSILIEKYLRDFTFTNKIELEIPPNHTFLKFSQIEDNFYLFHYLKEGKTYSLFYSKFVQGIKLQNSSQLMFEFTVEKNQKLEYGIPFNLQIDSNYIYTHQVIKNKEKSENGDNRYNINVQVFDSKLDKAKEYNRKLFLKPIPEKSIDFEKEMNIKKLIIEQNKIQYFIYNDLYKQKNLIYIDNLKDNTREEINLGLNNIITELYLKKTEKGKNILFGLYTNNTNKKLFPEGLFYYNISTKELSIIKFNDIQKEHLRSKNILIKKNRKLYEIKEINYNDEENFTIAIQRVFSRISSNVNTSELSGSPSSISNAGVAFMSQDISVFEIKNNHITIHDILKNNDNSYEKTKLFLHYNSINQENILFYNYKNVAKYMLNNCLLKSAIISNSKVENINDNIKSHENETIKVHLCLQFQVSSNSYVILGKLNDKYKFGTLTIE